MNGLFVFFLLYISLNYCGNLSLYFHLYCTKINFLFLAGDELPSPEPVRSLRRERKLNPRYSSSEYTSIFNCKKETFITKQTSPSIRNQTSTPSPKIESKLKKTDSFAENNKITKQSLVESKTVKMHSDEVETSEKNKSKLKKESQDKDDQLSSSKMSSSDELDSIMDTEKLFKENNKNNLITDEDKLKDHKKLKTHNNTKVRKNSQSLKRKLEVAESTPVKRPCSRSSVDSSSSEFAPNENKPFNSEKKDANEEKKLNDCSLKVSNLNIGVKKDLFCKQRTNNNGDILGQKDIFPKNSHSKVINNSENKTNESDTG